MKSKQNVLRNTTILALVTLLMLLMAACGGSSTNNYAAASTAANAGGEHAAPQAAGEAAYDMDGGGAYDTADGGATLTLPQDDRKVIVTANLTIEALEFEKTCGELQQAVRELGGYVSATDIQNGQAQGNRYANFTMRIPAERYADFILRAEAAGNMTSRNEQSEDVTDQYVDIESRLKTLRAEEAWLLEQLEGAHSLEDMIDLRDRLTEVQYNIEYYTAGKRTLDSLTAYSTVHIQVREVVLYTAPPDDTYGQKISNTFRDAWATTAAVFKAIGLFLVAIHPFLIFCALALVIALVIVRLVKKARAKRPPKPKAEARPQPPPPYYPAPYPPYPPGGPMPRPAAPPATPPKSGDDAKASAAKPEPKEAAPEQPGTTEPEKP